jgi:hypothetical protein
MPYSPLGVSVLESVLSVLVMNKRVILFHLNEAKEELDRTIQEIGKNGEYDVAEFRVAMSHLYHHLNTAWNGREMADDLSEERRHEFDLFRKFPSNEEMMLD